MHIYKHTFFIIKEKFIRRTMIAQKSWLIKHRSTLKSKG